MDERRYADEEYGGYAADEAGTPWWVWGFLGLAVIAAIVFGTLWYLRGDENARLTGEMRSAQTAAETAARSLQTDLDNARSQISAGTARAAQLEASLRDSQRTAADAARQVEQGLRAELAAQAERLQIATGELDDLRLRLAGAEEQAAAAASGIAAADAVREQLSAVQASLSAARAEAGRIKPLEDELAAARETIARLTTAEREGQNRASGRERELTAANAELRTELEQAGERLRRAESAAAAAAKETAAASAAADAVRGQLSGVQAGLSAARAAAGRIKPLEDELAAARETIARLTEAEREGQNRASGRERELTAALADLEEKAASQTASGTDLAARIASLDDELRRAVADGQRAREALDAAEKEFAGRLEAAGREFAERGKALAADYGRHEAEWRERLAAAAVTPEQPATIPARSPARPSVIIPAEIPENRPEPAPESVPPAAPQSGETGLAEPRHVVTGQPGRAVGRIVHVLEDGVTYLMNGGARQRVKPGMIFDVHRRLDGINRYIGLLQVTRTLDDYSLAVRTNPVGEVRICPVTGRAVLDPSVDHSPFARTEDGHTVPLIAASSLGLGREAPGIGDCLDNPFYAPDRIMIFYQDAAMPDDPRVDALIAGLGGMVSGTAAQADYAVVGNIDPTPEPAGQPRPITPDALAAYVVSAGL